MKANYEKNLKQVQDKRMKNNAEFISNDEIESTDKIYNPYLYRIQSFDNELERLAWLEIKKTTVDTLVIKRYYNRWKMINVK